MVEKPKNIQKLMDSRNNFLENYRGLKGYWVYSSGSYLTMASKWYSIKQKDKKNQ